LQSLKELQLQPCESPWWAWNGHLQTLGGHFIPSPQISPDGEKLEVPLPDGDRLFCLCYPGTSSLVISLYHGLSGDLNADYIQRAALLYQKMGHTVVLVNHRGVGEGAAYSRNSYHSGRGEDISAILMALRQKYPGKKQITVGFSMSGNIVLTLLAGLRGVEKPDGAITVNAAINLAESSRLLSQGFNRIYDLRFVARLREEIQAKYHLGLITKLYQIPRFSSVYDLDQIYTAEAGGFRDRDDYYASCSTYLHLSEVQTPTYMLTSADDPFILVKSYQEARLSSVISLHVEKVGGHLGYLSRRRTPLGSHRWLDYYLHESLRGLEALWL